MSVNRYQLASVLEAPIISEKSTVAAEKDKQFVFKVQKQATKKQVKSAVEMMFSVEVDSVRVLNVKGKQKRFGKSLGQRSDWKKAYVKLKPGHDIEFSAA
ncbi:MAG: 50S ribosomal protein L23 [Methylococcaceae bacterium]|nr:50S ribosomal protein L23 [Methylococcaceae bacterium]MDD1608959.1 50S ribosomal protein L23 [Methylococcaceae bacterium]MDD1615341.1 50S ribosomal protein L23 [Methylococcaceae bacterium]OYV20511.1 MAG: large subunit ribosomal protein L23 [Methylococcaceae bacterium NSP1-2]